MAQGIDNAALFSKIRKCNNDAVNFVPMFAKQIAAQPSFCRRFDRAKLRFFRGQGDGADAGRRQHSEHFFPARFRQVVGKKAAVAYNHAERHLFRHCYFLRLLAECRGRKPMV